MTYVPPKPATRDDIDDRPHEPAVLALIDWARRLDPDWHAEFYDYRLWGQKQAVTILAAHVNDALTDQGTTPEERDKYPVFAAMVGTITALLFLAERLGINFDAVVYDAQVNHDCLLGEPHPPEEHLG